MMPLLALERLINVRRKTSLFGCLQGKQFVLFKETLERVCETQTRVNYPLSQVDTLHVYSFFLMLMLSKSVWAMSISTGVASLLAAKIPGEDHHMTFFALWCSFFAARWIRRHLEMTSWDKSWSSLSRHDLLLKSALKNQPKWLAKDHPGYLWQWQLKSALLCSSLCPKQWFIISLFSRT